RRLESRRHGIRQRYPGGPAVRVVRAKYPSGHCRPSPSSPIMVPVATCVNPRLSRGSGGVRPRERNRRQTTLLSLSDTLKRHPRPPRHRGATRLCRVPPIECGEPLVDLRAACAGLEIKACPSFARESIARMLLHAQRLLPPELRLRVSTALRTLEQQSNGYWN